MSNAFIDPVVAEIHATRAAMLEAAGGDIRVLMHQVADRQRLSGRQIVRSPLQNRTEPSDPPQPPINGLPGNAPTPTAG